MLSKNINWGPLAIIVLMIGLGVSGCTTSYDPYNPRTYRQVTGGRLAGPPPCAAPRRTCCGGSSNCGVAYAAPYAPPRHAAYRTPYRDRYSIQPYPAYAYPGPSYGRPYGGRRGGSVSVVGPYGAESRSAYYGPYGSARRSTSARFY